MKTSLARLAPLTEFLAPYKDPVNRLSLIIQMEAVEQYWMHGVVEFSLAHWTGVGPFPVEGCWFHQGNLTMD